MTAPKTRIRTSKALLERAARADAAAVRMVAANRRAPSDLAAKVVSTAGRGGFVWTVLVAAVAARVRGAKAAPAAAPMVGGAFLLSAGAARLLGRRRPFQDSKAVRPIGERPRGPSFASDQAASAVAAASQRPSDVIARAALGGAAAWSWRRRIWERMMPE